MKMQSSLKRSNSKIIALTLSALLSQAGCSTYSKKIATGMFAGAAVGAAVGNQFAADSKNEQTSNIIVSSVLFALVAGGLLSWHFQEIEETKVEISGRYARYRLCDPADMPADLVKQLEFSKDSEGLIFQIPKEQVGKLAISLDDSTKWVYPSFRKRFLQPELGENQVVSERYIWEILKPGSFVTRSQNPQYFVEEPEKK